MNKGALLEGKKNQGISLGNKRHRVLKEEDVCFRFLLTVTD